MLEKFFLKSNFLEYILLAFSRQTHDSLYYFDVGYNFNCFPYTSALGLPVPIFLLSK